MSSPLALSPGEQTLCCELSHIADMITLMVYSDYEGPASAFIIVRPYRAQL